MGEGWGVGQAVGSSQQPACGQLGHATGRRAGSGQAADTPGRAGGIRGLGGQETDRQMGAKTWGPAAQRRHCRDRPDRGPGQDSRFPEGLGSALAGLAVGWEQRPVWPLEKTDDLH